MNMQFIRNLIASVVSYARYRKGGVGDEDFSCLDSTNQKVRIF